MLHLDTVPYFHILLAVLSWTYRDSLRIANQVNQEKECMMKKIVFAMIAAVAAMSAAQAQQLPRAYVGVGVATANSSDTVPGATASESGSYKANGKLFAGYEFNQTWGAELGYTDFRKQGQNITSNGVNGHAESKGHSVYLAAKATAPINERVSVYGKLGVADNIRELRATDPALNQNASKTEGYAAVGLQYNINQQVALTAEYERYGKKRDFGVKPDVWTVGARYSF
jgi:opacity protein-like surface antigen